MVLPSLLFFLVYPQFIKLGFRFWPALLSACLLMAGFYTAYIFVLKKLGQDF